jgi:UDP-3-O-[3-hydroxymyristoyl] glucosamine N-acyltransferase
MEFTAKAIADFLQGIVEGNPDVKLNTISKIEEGKLGALSFLSNPKYFKYIYTTQSSAVLVNHDFALEKPVSTTLIRVNNAYESFAKLLTLVSSMEQRKVGIHEQAIIEPTAKLGKDVYIGPFVYIGNNARIGDNVCINSHSFIDNDVEVDDKTLLYSGVKVLSNCRVGKNCVIHPGAVIGSDGFGFAPQADGTYQKIPQIGNVIIEDNVEIGANTTIDRATMGSTIIRKGVKLDNLIQVAHNVEIGENTVIAALTGIAGSAKVGPYCMIGGQVGIAGHISIAQGVKISAQAGVANHIKTPNEVLIGSPAMNAKKFSRSFVLFKNLPEIKMDIDLLKRKLNE